MKRLLLNICLSGFALQWKPKLVAIMWLSLQGEIIFVEVVIAL